MPNIERCACEFVDGQVRKRCTYHSAIEGRAVESERLRDELSTALGKLDPGAMFEFVKHGDQEHQDWLREAFEAYVAGRPKPEPRGLGRHGALIAELQSRLDTLREALECLLPGLVLDLRYADPDDDRDAMQSRIKTVTDALSVEKPCEHPKTIDTDTYGKLCLDCGEPNLPAVVENQMPFITREDIEKAALEPLPYDGRGMVVVERGSRIEICGADMDGAPCCLRKGHEGGHDMRPFWGPEGRL